MSVVQLLEKENKNLKEKKKRIILFEEVSSASVADCLFSMIKTFLAV